MKKFDKQMNMAKSYDDAALKFKLNDVFDNKSKVCPVPCFVSPYRAEFKFFRDHIQMIALQEVAFG